LSYTPPEEEVMTRDRALLVALGASVLVNLIMVTGLIAMAASTSTSNRITGWLHAPTNTHVQGLQFTSDDLEIRVSNLESAVGESQSVSDLATRVDDLETAHDSMCNQLASSEISELSDLYYGAC
jgi:hypothetical protein